MNIQIETCIRILKHAIKHGISASVAAKELNLGKNYLFNFLAKSRNMIDSGSISKKELNILMTHFEEYTNKKARNKKRLFDNLKTQPHNGDEYKIEVYEDSTGKQSATSNLEIESGNIVNKGVEPSLTIQQIRELGYDAYNDENYDNRSFGVAIRDSNNKIQKYHYRIIMKNEEPIEGYFSRDEMNIIYQRYSKIEGAGLTLRTVAREFPNLSIKQFKRILRAFDITKESLALAPHIIDENTSDEVMDMLKRNQESLLIKKIEEDKHKNIEKYLLEAKKTIIEQRQDIDLIEKLIEKYHVDNPYKGSKQFKKESVAPIINKGGSTPSICIFGDVHFGKFYNRTTYGRGYSKEIAHDRLVQIADYIIYDFKIRNPSEIIIISLGDILESVMEDGMHPGHSKEMDLTQTDQVLFAIESLETMLRKIKTSVNCPIQLHSIQGNHDRIGKNRDDDKTRTMGKVVFEMLKKIFKEDKQFLFFIPENNLSTVITGNLCLFSQHGDSLLNKLNPYEIINMWGKQTHYNVLFTGHWHSLKVIEGTNFLSIKAPSVASSDAFIHENIGKNTLAGFIMGHQPVNCSGFNYSKITLY